jgi:hypothetical protein
MEEIMEKRLSFKIPLAVVTGISLFFASAYSGVSLADNPAPATDTVEYVLEDIQGPNVQVKEDGADAWEAAQEGQVVENGDEVKAGDNSEVTLMLQSDTSVHLMAQTDMKVGQIQANQTGGFISRLKLFAGQILADVKKNLQSSKSVFELESSGVVCGVRGTAFEMTVQGDSAQVATHEGEVEVRNGVENWKVNAGNFSEFRAGKFRLQRLLGRMEIQRFQKWRNFRKAVFLKRTHRLADIRKHVRKAWIRRHPHLMMKMMKNHPDALKNLKKRNQNNKSR